MMEQLAKANGPGSKGPRLPPDGYIPVIHGYCYIDSAYSSFLALVAIWLAVTLKAPQAFAFQRAVAKRC